MTIRRTTLRATASRALAAAAFVAVALTAPGAALAQDKPAHTVASRDTDAERAITQRAAAERRTSGDAPAEQVARGIALFHRNHPGYVAPGPGPDGVAPIDAVIKAADRSRVPASARAAGTECTPSWGTIQWGDTGRMMVPRHYPETNSYPVWTNGNPQTEPWNTWVLLCRDNAWSAGDYAIYFNATSRYLRVGWGDVLYGDATSISGTGNLLRIRQYDGNWQTLWSPLVYGWVTGQTDSWIGAGAVGLNGNTLFKVRPMPSGLPCDPYGIC